MLIYELSKRLIFRLALFLSMAGLSACGPISCQKHEKAFADVSFLIKKDAVEHVLERKLINTEADGPNGLFCELPYPLGSYVQSHVSRYGLPPTQINDQSAEVAFYFDLDRLSCVQISFHPQTKEGQKNLIDTLKDQLSSTLVKKKDDDKMKDFEVYENEAQRVYLTYSSSNTKDHFYVNVTRMARQVYDQFASDKKKLNDHAL